MKIVYLHQYFNTPTMSGGTRSYEMARRFVLRGHDVHIVTSNREGSKEGLSGWYETKEAGIRVHWLPLRYSNKMPYWRRILAFLVFAFKSTFKVFSLKGDIVFATSTPLTIAIPALIVTKLRRIPMVFEVRDLWPEIPIRMGALKNPLMKWLAGRLEELAYKGSTRVVVLSPDMKMGVERTGYPPNKIAIIPNSCDIDLFSQPAQVGIHWRSGQKWLGDRPLLVYAGAMGLINGVGYLAKLAAKVKDVLPEMRFLVIGSGREQDQIRELAQKLGVYEKNFFMWDRIPKEQLPQIFSASNMIANIVINVEEVWANSANKFFDALAAGKPVVINSGGWQRDLLESAGAGLVLDCEDIDAAARKLAQAVCDEEWQRTASANAAELARERFSRDILVDKLAVVLDDAYCEYGECHG